MVLNNAIRVGSKFLLRAAVMSTGKYGMGINTITLDAKLNKTIPRYSSSRPKVKKFSMITNWFNPPIRHLQGLKVLW